MELACGKKNKFFTSYEEGKNRYYIEDFDTEVHKYNNNVFLLSEQIEPKSLVLDIGCGSGVFGEKLKNKKCIVYGIEMDEEAIDYANRTGAYKQIFCSDITKQDTNLDENLKSLLGKVDFIILSNILEHLVDPTELLIKCYSILKNDGVLLVSVPNIAHIDIIINLLNGKFNYTDMGILDNTHLKFFTKKSFVEWIDQINKEIKNIYFDVEYIGNTFYNNETIQNLEKDHKELFNLFEMKSEFNALEILFKLKKVENINQVKNLNSILHEQELDIIDIFGSIFKKEDVYKELKSYSISSERLWYKEKLEEVSASLNWHIEKVKELNDTLEGYQESDKSKTNTIIEKDEYIEVLEKSLNWHIRKVKELNDTLEGYQESDKSKTNIIIEKDEYIKEKDQILKAHENSIEVQEQELDKLKKENFNLKKTIFEMENSLSWKITKFIRKK